MRAKFLLTVAVAGLLLPGLGSEVRAGTTNIAGWGLDGDGQASPPEGDDYVAIAAGDGHSLALNSDGSIVGWGWDSEGQASPPAGNDYVGIAAGDRYSLALKADGSIVGWGTDFYGQASPPAGNDYVAVSAGGRHSLALRADGSIVGWGDDEDAPPPAGTDYVAIAAGSVHSLALRANGSIVGWGEDGLGQASPPVGNDYVAIAAGGVHSLALRSDGSIVGWGFDNFGQASPPAGNDYVAVSAGDRHSLGLRSDGSIVGWGSDGHGQASPPTHPWFTAVAAGNRHSLALVDGELLAPTSPYGEYTPLTPVRILDTRTGNGRNGVIAPLGENRSFAVQVTGRGGVAASGVSAVVMNVTVTQPTASSHLRVWPAGEDRPLVANLNFVAGQTVPNLVTVAVGANGRVNVFNRFGSTHVIFDVVGFYADDAGPAGSRFHAIPPFRFFDTRVEDGGPFGPLGPDSIYDFNVFDHGILTNRVTAVTLNVAITQPTQRSYLTVFPGDVGSPPLAANQNYVPGLTRSNQVIVRVPPSGIIKFYNRFGSVHIIVDAVGYYDDDKSTQAGRFVPVVPYRAFDSREDADGPIGPDQGWYIGTPPGFAGFPPDEAEAVVLNVAATQPTERSYLTVFPSHLCEVPLAASLNFGEGQNVPNHVVARLSTPGDCADPDWLGTIAVYNRFGYVHVVLDMFGFFTAPTNPYIG